MTLDVPVPGVRIAQPRRGFRYGSEAFWLVGFALEGGAASTALDLGTGSGIAALLLARHGLQAVGWDHRPEWRPCWERTLAASDVGGRVRLEVRDVLEAPEAGRVADLVVSNPPFFPRTAGPASGDPWRAAARTESTATLADFVAAGATARRRGGRLCLVIPSGRAEEAVQAGEGVGLALRRWLAVGRCRTLVELGERPERQVQRGEIGERDERVQRWYAALAAPLPPS